MTFFRRGARRTSSASGAPSPDTLGAMTQAVGGRLADIPAPDPEPAPEPPRVPATSPLFRERAVMRYRRGEGVAEVLEVESSMSLSLFLTVAAAVVAAVGFATFGFLEVVSRARGVMRPLDGVVAVAAQVEGLVAEVHAVAGQEVRRGDPLIRVDSAALRAQVLAAKRQIEVADEQLAYLARQRERLHAAAHAWLDQRAALAQQRIVNQRAYVDRLDARTRVAATLDEQGVLAKRDVDVLQDERGAAERSLLGMRGEFAESRLESNRLERAHDDAVRDWTSRKREAEAQLESAELLLSRTEVRAAFDGTIDALLVRPGAQVSPSTPVGRIIPKALSERVVVFIPERDRAFVRAGSPVRLAIDQLPVGEFGALSGRVVRVARAIATPAEIADVLGAGAEDGILGPHFRVEVALVDNDKRRQLAPYLRTGALLTAHITLRKQRVIALIVRPLKELIER